MTHRRTVDSFQDEGGPFGTLLHFVHRRKTGCARKKAFGNEWIVCGQTLVVELLNPVPLCIGFANLKRPSVEKQIPIGAHLRPNRALFWRSPVLFHSDQVQNYSTSETLLKVLNTRWQSLCNKAILVCDGFPDLLPPLCQLLLPPFLVLQRTQAIRMLSTRNVKNLTCCNQLGTPRSIMVVQPNLATKCHKEFQCRMYPAKASGTASTFPTLPPFVDITSSLDL